MHQNDFFVVVVIRAVGSVLVRNQSLMLLLVPLALQCEGLGPLSFFVTL